MIAVLVGSNSCICVAVAVSEYLYLSVSIRLSLHISLQAMTPQAPHLAWTAMKSDHLQLDLRIGAASVAAVATAFVFEGQLNGTSQSNGTKYTLYNNNCALSKVELDAAFSRTN